MHRIASTLTLGFLLAMTGCPSDDSPSGPSQSSSGSADTTMGNPSTSMPSNVDTTAGPTTGDPDPTTGDPDPTTGDPDPTTGDPDPTTGDPTGDPTGGGGMACDPDPADDECAACIKASCCEQLEVCLADGDATTGCVCFQECVQAGGDPLTECNETCMVNPLDQGTPTGSIGSCTLLNCNVCL